MKNISLMVLVNVVLFGCGTRINSPVVNRADSSAPSSRASTLCLTQGDLTTAIDKLSSEAQSETDSVRKDLINDARESPECRAQVVNGLIQVMDKPDLNFVSDRSSFYLWSNGSAILGELKAVESLDLLIEHLDLNDGEFSASMSHQPAFQGVTLMGVLAIPKLGLALEKHKNQRIRLTSALCLTEIGGPDAMTVLGHSLNAESDRCVRRVIETSISILDRESRSKPPASSSNELIELRRKLLISYRCID